jgi:hypothetical protein
MAGMSGYVWMAELDAKAPIVGSAFAKTRRAKSTALTTLATLATDERSDRDAKGSSEGDAHRDLIHRDADRGANPDTNGNPNALFHHRPP